MKLAMYTKATFTVEMLQLRNVDASDNTTSGLVRLVLLVVTGLVRLVLLVVSLTNNVVNGSKEIVFEKESVTVFHFL